jgi:hypothetical protein
MKTVSCWSAHEHLLRVPIRLLQGFQKPLPGHVGSLDFRSRHDAHAVAGTAPVRAPRKGGRMF